MCRSTDPSTAHTLASFVLRAAEAGGGQGWYVLVQTHLGCLVGVFIFLQFTLQPLTVSQPLG